MTSVSERQERLARARRQYEVLSHKGLYRAEPRYCRHEGRMVEAIGPSPAWRTISKVLGVVGFVVLFAVIAMDPFGIAALLTALLYIATLGPALALARKVPVCTECGRETPYHSRAEAEAPMRQPSQGATA